MTPTQFGAILASGSEGALPYIAGGVGAGAIIWVVVIGIRLALRIARSMSDGRSYQRDPDGWWDRYRDDQ